MVESPTLKKIFDSIFEPDPEGNETPAKEPVRLKAEDILYEKKNKAEENKAQESNPIEDIFVNYKPSYKHDEVIAEPTIEEYEPSQHISPIFGVIDDKKKKDTDENSVPYANTKRPSSSHLGAVISPFFGYETKKEKVIEEEKEEELEDFDVTEDLGDIFATDEFKQEIKEEKINEEIDLFSDFYISEDK